MNNSKVVEIEDLWFSFNGTYVLKEVNLTIHERDFIAIIGPNGGGKTTLLKLILGLLEPDKGKIRMLGRPNKEMVSHVGYVPQDIHVNRGFPISVHDVVSMGRIRGGGRFRRLTREDKTRIKESLERVEMWEYRSRHMDDLSGGQRQRVFLARALVSDPEILFLDEPISSVDKKGQTDFYDFLRELNKKTTIIIITHDAMVLSSHAKSVACVNRELFFHHAPEITADMLEMAYQCPVDLIAHGLPHRVFKDHEED